MQNKQFLFFSVAALAVQSVLAAAAPSFSFPPSYPYADKVGTASTTALAKDDAAIVAWATGVDDYTAGTHVDATWQATSNGLGVAQGTPYDIVCLGRGGQITLTFQQPIFDGTGDDFAVFENSFSDQFLEIAWVEVSSDGEHFVRFPNFSQTFAAVGGFGTVDANKLHGFAGKYRGGYGTPFDLAEIKAAHAAAVNNPNLFPSSYSADLLANFGEVDFEDIRYVRLIDVVGDGSQTSALRKPNEDLGYTLYDPYPTVGSAGFDLDAVAVMHQVSELGLPQTIEFSTLQNQRFADGSIDLQALSSSGLDVVFEVLSGPAYVSGARLYFTGLGLVTVQAIQSGDASYASAVPVVQSFYVADELQHIFILPPSNQLVAAAGVGFTAVSSSGLPVRLFIEAGPDAAYVEELNHVFSSGPLAGVVTLRGTQAGGVLDGVTYAPANDVRVEFAIVESESVDAPRSFTSWQSVHGLSGDASLDSDGDGQTDLEEYLAGSDPLSAGDPVSYPLVAVESGFEWTVRIDQRALVDLAVESCSDLSAVDGWSEITPEIIDIVPIPEAVDTCYEMRLRLPKAMQTAQFWRLNLQAKPGL